jgi:hypothetical protein
MLAADGNGAWGGSSSGGLLAGASVSDRDAPVVGLWDVSASYAVAGNMSSDPSAAAPMGDSVLAFGKATGSRGRRDCEGSTSVSPSPGPRKTKNKKQNQARYASASAELCSFHHTGIRRPHGSTAVHFLL